MSGISDGGTSIHSGPAPARSRPPILGIVLVVAALVGAGVLVRETRKATAAKELALKQQTASQAGGESASAGAETPSGFSTVRGQQTTWLPRVRVEGTLAAHQSSEVAFRIVGKLRQVYVKLGDQVQAGQWLGELDSVQATAQKAAGEAQVRARTAQLVLAEDAQQRMRSLVDNGAMADTVVVKNEQERALAVAQLDAAKAEVNLAEIALKYHVVIAPFSGVVTRVPSGIGAVVGPQQPSFEIVDTSKLNLSTSVSEQDAGLFATGAGIELEGLPMEAKGKVEVVLPTVDPRTRRVTVQAAFPGQPGLRPGSLVRGWILPKSEISVVRLPGDVLRPGSSDEVFVVNPSTSRIEARRLTLTKQEDGSLLVRVGVTISDDVLVGPTSELASGDAVTLKARVAQ